MKELRSIRCFLFMHFSYLAIVTRAESYSACKRGMPAATHSLKCEVGRDKSDERGGWRLMRYPALSAQTTRFCICRAAESECQYFIRLILARAARTCLSDSKNKSTYSAQAIHLAETMYLLLNARCCKERSRRAKYTEMPGSMSRLANATST